MISTWEQTGQWNKIDYQELDLRVYENLIQEKQDSVQRRKNGLFNKWCFQNLPSTSKKTVGAYLLLCIKINSREITMHVRQKKLRKSQKMYM